jgi:hypothetical protein
MQGLELAGSILSFLGGLFLSIEAFLVRRRIRMEAGAARLHEILKKTRAVLEDGSGKPLESEKDLRVWLAERSLLYSWIGFGLMTFGFVLDILSQLIRA